MSDSSQPVNEPRRPRRFRNWLLPLASGRVSVLVMVICLAVAVGLALLIGARLDLPVWVRWEIIVVAWWLIWLVTLSRLLYSGTRVTHDHMMSTPRNWFRGMSGGAKDAKSSKNSRGSGGSGGSWDILGGADLGEGCLYLLAALIALIVAIIAVWFLIEIAIPAIAFILYVLIRGMLARVVNDFHGCKGHLGRALSWASLWATLYTAPLAGLIWIAHVARVDVRLAAHATTKCPPPAK